MVPGTDAAYLAMDIEDGVEVIWNEVTFAEKKDFISKEKSMMENLDSLISIGHANIVKVSALHQNTNPKLSRKSRILISVSQLLDRP